MKGLDDVCRISLVSLNQRACLCAHGGLAVRIHALPRPTFDIDFTALIPRANLSPLYGQAESLGYTVPPAQRSGWVDSVKGMALVKFQFFVGGHAIDVDVFLAETDFQSRVLERRQRHRTEGFEAWFVSAEDLVLLKLLAG